jgi:hypothetical protein
MCSEEGKARGSVAIQAHGGGHDDILMTIARRRLNAALPRLSSGKKPDRR